MHDTFEVWEAIGMHIKNKDKLIEWIEEHTSDFEEQHIEELTEHICIYLFNLSQKDAEKYGHSIEGRTYNERKADAKKQALKLYSTLLNGISTPKGQQLIDSLTDLIEHPEEYLFKPSKAYASFDMIDGILQTYKTSKEARKELLDILKN